MSTNFYWAAKTITGKYVTTDDPEIHIGMRWGLGGGKIGFAWAQEKASVVTLCSQHMDKEIIVDEYHRPITGAQFLEMLTVVAKEEFNIGGWFS